MSALDIGSNTTGGEEVGDLLSVGRRANDMSRWKQYDGSVGLSTCTHPNVVICTKLQNDSKNSRR